GRKVLPPTARPTPGDTVFYGQGPESSTHVGIVQRVYPDGRITAIEGNYANHVALVGPFLPADATSAGETAPVYGYAQPPSPSRVKE
ncbi:MAG: CHAP domain-containing protein, partial [Solirubrobacteraceae bacterium]